VSYRAFREAFGMAPEAVGHQPNANDFLL